ncbi:hypothetical protein EJC51_47535 [Streptomyces aquilus]|uniref:Uncharacterized protein n=1 Tax=Streptomyces aquilus TaxID=2548456 RepID=A0A3Q9BUI2_9ACTN|nr:hypothetical protein [Streptomyces aquilus]AZP14701.1 hypothetical protein EJC51_00010 [Streptomyces aquilus]AZP23003.1 hypothetical protein EJC51_47535 [Streptomyces aquilus]
MSARPEITHPGDDAIAAAMSRTLTALSAVFQALGNGEHTLNLVAERTDNAFVTGRTDLSIGMEPLRLAVLDEDEFCAFRMLLVFALEASTMRSAVLIATTAAEPNPRACGWSVRDGWLHPLDTDGLQAAVTPCPDVAAVEREVYPAPVLLQLPDSDLNNPHA